MKILVTGANGMLGTDLCSELKAAGFEVLPATLNDFDITDKAAAEEYLYAKEFDALVHCAAYTNVDAAEVDRETAFKVNETATSYLAEITAKKNVPIIYISTDYVFDGTKTTPYLSDERPNPINVYGESKLAGEIAVKTNPKHYITRISWLYGLYGKNFVETMINLAQNNQNPLKVVDDQTGCPTWTVDVAKGVIKLLREKFQYGTYHLSNSGYTTWYGFACEIMKLAAIEKEVIPVSSEEFKRPADRPKYGVLDNNNISRDWKLALNDYLQLRKKTDKDK